MPQLDITTLRLQRWWNVYDKNNEWLGMTCGLTEADARRTFLSCLAEPQEVEARIGKLEEIDISGIL